MLTGVSLCGKSEIAKKIATNFYENGYDYRLTSEIEKIERFFSSNIQDSKVAILEDPFGHSKPVGESYQKHSKLESLIRNSQAHHKLLVTSRLEILLEIGGTENLDDCSINSIAWHNLTINDPSVLNQYWEYFAREKLLPEAVSKSVSKDLTGESGSHHLQIGQLIYLANQEPSTLLDKKPSELDHIARHNSKDVAKSIKEKDTYYAEVLFVLSLCCNTIESIRFTGLAFILYDNEENPSVRNEEDIFISYGNYEPQLPTYSSQYALLENAVHAIEYLEERQLIKVLNENIVFSHPNYLQAGRYLFLSTSETRKRRYTKYLKRCVTCLSPTNAYIASRSISFIAKKVSGQLENEVMKTGFIGLRSIFPSVEDSCLVFLIESLPDLKEKERKVVVECIQNGGTDSF